MVRGSAPIVHTNLITILTSSVINAKKQKHLALQTSKVKHLMTKNLKRVTHAFCAIMLL